jgi:chromosome partitioning protein
MHVIAVATFKGGAGKTTTSLQLAAELLSRGQRVLLVDLDTSADATVGTGLAAAKGAVPPLLLALSPDDDTTIPDVVTRSPWGFDVLPSAGSRQQMVEHLVADDSGWTLLRDALQSASAAYDFVVVDCPAQYGAFTRLGLTAASHALIPLELGTKDSIRAMPRTLSMISRVQSGDNPDLRILGVLPCRKDRTRLARELVELLRHHDLLGRHLLRRNEKVITIREAAAVRNAKAQNQPVRTHSPRSPVVRDFSAVADVVMEVCL